MPPNLPYRLLTTRNVVLVTLPVGTLTVLEVWFSGRSQHRTLFANSLISTSLLFGAFFLFVTIGLYHGIKLKDNIGRLTDRINRRHAPDVSNLSFDADLPALEGDFVHIVFALMLWLVAAVISLLFIWLLLWVLWAGILTFAAMLYWVFFRALRLVFKDANHCRGRLLPSVGRGFGYASLYSVWIYSIILAAHYLR